MIQHIRRIGPVSRLVSSRAGTITVPMMTRVSIEGRDDHAVVRLMVVSRKKGRAPLLLESAPKESMLDY
jgi:hypothetical protein